MANTMKNGSFNMSAAAFADGAFSCSASLMILLDAIIMASIFVVLASLTLISLLALVSLLVLASLIIALVIPVKFYRLEAWHPLST